MEKTILLASHNNHKIIEFNQIFEPLGFNVVGLKDVGIEDDFPEDGNSFQENSLLKAQQTLGLTAKYMIISDDSGIEIAALDNGPGIYTHRYLSSFSSKEEAFKTIIDKCKLFDNYQARFKCVLTLMLPNGFFRQFEGVIEGLITKSMPLNVNAFGYDPIFIPDGYEVSFANMDNESKNKLSHRGKASAELVKYLSKWSEAPLHE